MALKNYLMLGSLLAILMISEAAWGQVDIPSPKFQYKSVEQPKSTRPFATPGVFDYDAQMFAPIEFSNGEELGPRSGFFASYDRTVLSFQKGTQTIAGVDGPSTGNHYVWGTRIEAGWMTDVDDGWGLVYQYGNGITYASGQDISVPQPFLVDSQASDFELNKLFRQALNKGGYFEPYVGLRYYNMSDNTIQDTLQGVQGGTAVGTPFILIAGNRFKQNVTNSAIGGQAGARYNSRRGKWRLTSDGAIAMFYNQKRLFATDITTASIPNQFQQIYSETYDANQSFVPMLDLQLDLAYNLTRDISLRGGLQLNYLWNGIARANTAPTNLNPNSIYTTVGTAGAGLNQDVSFITAGFLFGVEWRR